MDPTLFRGVFLFNAGVLGLVLGLVFGLGVFVATNWLVIKGGEPVGPHLQLLGQYFIGYEVTPIGSLIGFAWGFASGFALGWIGAGLRNFIVSIYVNIFKLRGRMTAVRDFIDNP